MTPEHTGQVNKHVTRIFNDPRAFADQALAGLATAYPDHVIRVDGGIIRAAVSRPGQVAVVIGGGSGHYPAFAGLVGPGLATAAVCGQIFASPSAGQAYRVGRAVENGGGVLFTYCNYAGDRMQFGQAELRLRQEGLDARTVVVTDDIASAPLSQAEDRRGIAGGLVVFKVAGAAAESGLSLDEVERLARKANDSTRTLGVAFAGCTLPGADAPLFTVPPGEMSVGLGIHGEPGIRDVSTPSAHDLAEMLVTSLLGEKPDGAPERAVVLLNSLGTIKHEEQFVLFGEVAAQLATAGVEIIDRGCGDFVTSLDMSGVSLTLSWLDDELAQWWSAPADTPAYNKTPRVAFERRDINELGRYPVGADEDATSASRQMARLAASIFLAAAETLHAHEEELGRLDAVAGDGDHGAGMRRGADGALKVARDKLAHEPGVRELLTAASEEWSDQAGGASGALWSAALLAMASSLGNRASYDGNDLVKSAQAARDAMAALGQAEPGDKTIVDAVFPFVATLEAQVALGKAVPDALTMAAAAATQAAAATAPLRPRRGRARPLAERSVGTPDPGAVSFALVMTAVADAVVSSCA